MPNELTKRSCIPCRGGVPPLEGEKLHELSEQLPSWKVVDERRIAKTFTFPDFAAGLAFVNQVGELAEAEGHHPDLCLAWGRVDITIYTHTIGGLTESDFILGAKIDEIRCNS